MKTIQRTNGHNNGNGHTATPTTMERWTPDRKELLTPFDTWVDKVFQDMLSTDKLGANFFQNGAYPRVDVRDYSDRVEIEADIPGLTRDDITISIEDDVLSIYGDKQTTDEKKEDFRYLKRELKRSSFKRSFSLSDMLNQDEIEASFTDGTLTITIPKHSEEEVSTKKEIEIK